MTAVCDVNTLLALCYQGHIHHTQAVAWFDQQDDLSVILCRMTQLGLLRLLTNPAVMRTDVRTLEQAWGVYDLLISDGRIEFENEPADVDSHLRRLSNFEQVSPKLWQDAYLAAFASAGNHSMVTFDQGFKKFNGLRLILLGN
jgi:uncharacterized protein